jgi:hypothetical protein
MNRALEYIFKNVPKTHFKLEDSGFVSTGSAYYVDGDFHDEFRHQESPLSVIVNVDTNTIVAVKYGRYHVVL